MRLLAGLGRALGNVIGVIGLAVVAVVEVREAGRKAAQLPETVHPGDLLGWVPLDEPDGLYRPGHP